MNIDDPSEVVSVYRADPKYQMGFIESWRTMIVNVWGVRGLILQLCRRDFVGAYKKSFLGMAWAFVSPLLGIISWMFLQYTGLLQPGETDIPYPCYVLMGTSMWGLFVGYYQAAQRTLSSGESLVLQVRYPHEALLFKEAASHVATFTITFVMNLMVLAAFRITPNWTGLLLLPIVSLPLFFLGSAVGLMVSMLNVVAVDLSRTITIILGLLQWVTPVIYSSDVPSSLVRTIIRWNPLTYLVCSCRDIVLYGRLYEPAAFVICAAVSFLLFLVSWRTFYVSEPQLVERML